MIPGTVRSWQKPRRHGEFKFGRMVAARRLYHGYSSTAKAKAAYQDFLSLWKDADPDIPILIAAKAEYAKLH